MVSSTRFNPSNEYSFVIRVLLNRPVELADADLVAVPQRSVENAADGEAPEIFAVIQVVHQNLQNAVGVAFGLGICVEIASKSGRRFSDSSSGFIFATPSFALVYTTGKSS